jgi:hypothetical protein
MYNTNKRLKRNNTDSSIITPQLPADAWFMIIDSFIGEDYIYEEYEQQVLVLLMLSMTSSSLYNICKLYKNTYSNRETFADLNKNIIVIICKEISARYGYLNVIKFLDSRLDTNMQCQKGQALSIIDFCAVGGHLDCLTYCHEKGYFWNQFALNSAIRGKSIECLRYVLEHDCPWPDDAYETAVMEDQLDMLKYMLGKKHNHNVYLCEDAADFDSIQCLMYLHENGYKWDEAVCYKAARSGSLRCLKYAHEKGCPWNEDTCEGAFYANELSCLQYAHEHGCPWNPNKLLGDLRFMRPEYIASNTNAQSCIAYVKLKAGI